MITFYEVKLRFKSDVIRSMQQTIYELTNQIWQYIKKLNVSGKEI